MQTISSKLTDAPILLVAPRKFESGRIPPGATLKKILARHLKRYDTIIGHGYKVRILGGLEENEFTQNLDYFTRFIEQERPGSVLRLPIQDHESAWAIGWPSDIFQAYGNLVFAADRREKLTKEILKSLGIEAAVETSKLGDGGCIVRDGSKLVISKACMGETEIDVLEGRYELHFLPYMTTRKAMTPNEWRLADRMERLHGHIDVEYGQVSEVAYTTPAYYQKFRDDIEALKGKTWKSLFVIPENEAQWKGANLRVMHGPKVIIYEQCRETAQYLEEKLGPEKVIRIPGENLDFAKNGGFKCKTNLIE